MVAGVLVSAEFADGRYAHYNYDVSQAGGVASGLPAYSAHGGLKSVNYGLFVARDLNANLLDGGLSIGVGGMYGHLYGSAAATPITAIRGSVSQWTFGAGLGYVF
jgi:outer membrane scaffolding protein for murein synthesis (MipA/OmpV family)